MSHHLHESQATASTNVTHLRKLSEQSSGGSGGGGTWIYRVISPQDGWTDHYALNHELHYRSDADLETYINGDGDYLYGDIGTSHD